MLGIRSRPWLRNRNHAGRPRAGEDPVCHLSKQNCKAYTDIGRTSKLLVKHLAVLETGAGTNFIRRKILPPRYKNFIRTGNSPVTHDANGKPMSKMESISLLVRVRSHCARITIFVCKKLDSSIILFYYFCDKFVEPIYPGHRHDFLGDGSKLPIVRELSTRAAKSLPVPMEQLKSVDSGRLSPLIKVAKSLEIAADSQAWVVVPCRLWG